MKRIGLFSGTFDPFHHGHLEACLVTLGVLNLDEVLVLVEKAPKRKSGVTDYNHRKSIVEQSLSDHRRINFQDFPYANVTFSNVKMALASYSSTTFVLIIGSDLLEHISDWPGFSGWANEHEVVVVLRDNNEKPKAEKQLNLLVKKYPKLKISLLPAVWSPISSSLVRQELAKTGSSDGLVPAALTYVQKHHLYVS